ncbi:MAG TPA: hypothetical protein VFY58_02700 [Nocardioides sp.]|nr:hypothetical protein [Nocardioides sp.]
MNQQQWESTRQTLHGVAELVLAGPQHALSGTIRLRATPGGFGTVATPHLRVEELELVSPTTRVPLSGTFAGLARAAGVEARTLREVYDEGPAVTPDDPVVVDPDAVDVIVRSLAHGDAALRTFAPDQEPVLWPEHFDIAITLAEVNYGVSLGDAHLPEPYAYVGPWAPREGAFWNASFGATRALSELPDLESLVGFFRTGSQRAAEDQLEPDGGAAG